MCSERISDKSPYLKKRLNTWRVRPGRNIINAFRYRCRATGSRALGEKEIIKKNHRTGVRQGRLANATSAAAAFRRRGARSGPGRACPVDFRDRKTISARIKIVGIQGGLSEILHCSRSDFAAYGFLFFTFFSFWFSKTFFLFINRVLTRRRRLSPSPPHPARPITV